MNVLDSKLDKHELLQLTDNIENFKKTLGKIKLLEREILIRIGVELLKKF